MSSTNSGVPGIFYYDHTDGTCETVYSATYNWKYMFELSNGDVLIGSDRNPSGLVLFDHTTKSCSQLQASGSYYGAFVEISNNRCIVAQSPDYGSSVIHTYIYDIINKSLTELSTTSYKWLCKLPNGNVILTTSAYDYIGNHYNVSTGEFTKIGERLRMSKIDMVIESGSNYILSSTQHNQSYVLNPTTLIATPRVKVQV